MSFEHFYESVSVWGVFFFLVVKWVFCVVCPKMYGNAIEWMLSHHLVYSIRFEMTSLILFIYYGNTWNSEKKSLVISTTLLIEQNNNSNNKKKRNIYLKLFAAPNSFQGFVLFDVCYNFTIVVLAVCWCPAPRRAVSAFSFSVFFFSCAECVLFGRGRGGPFTYVYISLYR